MSVNSKRKFLIATANKQTQDQLQSIIEGSVTDAVCFYAVDGSDAISKIQNDPPDVILTEPGLSKTDGFKLTNWILRNQYQQKMAVIILTYVPDTEHFVDEVVTSQVQFFDPTKGEAELKRILTRSLNFLSHKENQEFFIRFLAAGDCLIKEGDKADNAYLVKNGELVASSVRDGKKVILGKISAGEFVGEMAYINGEPRSADVYAEGNCELIAIPINILDQVLFTKVAWSKSLMKTLSKRIKNSNKAKI